MNKNKKRKDVMKCLVPPVVLR